MDREEGDQGRGERRSKGLRRIGTGRWREGVENRVPINTKLR